MDDGAPEGLVVGRFFAACTRRELTGMKTTGLVMPRWASFAPAAEGGPSESAGPTIPTWARLGDLNSGINFTKTDGTLCPGTPTGDQRAAIETILSMARASSTNGFGFNVSALLYGPPGSGKTQVGLYLALALGGAACLEHNPLDPGGGLVLLLLLLKAGPTKTKPLVVALNEWDACVQSVFTTPGKYRGDIAVPEVWGKSSYCNYMDRFPRHDNVPFVFTANSAPEELARIDPAIVRDGRFDVVLQLRAVSTIAKLRAVRFAPPARPGTGARRAPSRGPAFFEPREPLVRGGRGGPGRGPVRRGRQLDPASSRDTAPRPRTR